MNRASGALTALLIGLVVVIVAAFVFADGKDDEGDPTAKPATTSIAPPTTGGGAGTTTTTTPPTSRPAPSDVTEPSGDLALVTGAWPTNWSLSTIDLAELKIGIRAQDPRDQIRPIDSPTYEAIESANDWLVDREIGLSLAVDGRALFYPFRILTSHEIVNDVAGDVPFAVTYCPLCNTAVAFDRRIDGEVLRLGVSGLLRNSDLVMWDNSTTSLWQQITGEAVVGDFAGSRLTVLPTATVNWADFKAANPDGEALSQDTGFGFNYGANSYVGYSNRAAPFSQLFDADIDERFPALDRVVGVRVDDSSKAYPFAVIDDIGAVNDELAGVPLAVWWAPTESADNFDGARVGQGESIGTGIAFIREIDGQVLTFAPDADATFRDNETGSTWTLFGKAVSGPLAGSQLELALHQNEFWFAWSTFNQGAPVYSAP